MPGPYVDFGITSGAIKTSRGSKVPFTEYRSYWHDFPLLWEHMWTIESLLYRNYATKGWLWPTQIFFQILYIGLVWLFLILDIFPLWAGVSILMSYGENPHYVKLPIFSEFMENSTGFMKNSGLTALKSQTRDLLNRFPRDQWTIIIKTTCILWRTALSHTMKN